MDEGRKRVIGLMAAILASLHMQSADDLFGGPQGSPRTDKLIAASIQWAAKTAASIPSWNGVAWRTRIAVNPIAVAPMSEPKPEIVWPAQSLMKSAWSQSPAKHRT
jgi:hypothetical protein